MLIQIFNSGGTRVKRFLLKLNTRTIIASASAAGRGGVSVIRMSGEDSKSIAEKMCGELSEPWNSKSALFHLKMVR